jgi:transposase-like protein
METPRSLTEAILKFSDPNTCLKYVASIRWPNGPECPRCDAKGEAIAFMPTRGLWRCKGCKKQFSVKIGTIFEDSPIGLDKWLTAMWLVNNCKNGVSSYEIARDVEVTQRTAWFMLHRIRLVMQTRSFSKPLGGEIEADETFIGGKARNMHAKDRARKIHGRGPDGKAVVAAVLERHGEVRVRVVATRRKKDVQGIVTDNVAPGSAVFSDALKSYEGLQDTYTHQVIDHAEAYVKGNVHTNGLENFWSLLKRGIHGTYISIEPFHLFRYVDEQAFRFNNRNGNDGERFETALGRIVGRRLTYNEVRGKV